MQTVKLLENLERSIDSCMLVERSKLQNELRQVQRTLRSNEADEQAQQRLAALAEQITASITLSQQRRQSMPVIRYPETLPVVARLDDLKAAITAHQVVIDIDVGAHVSSVCVYNQKYIHIASG